jgi:hypothetical protein
VTIDDVRAYVADLPRSYEAFVRGRVKFRVGRIVYLAFSKDETLMGFAFPREERQMLVETYPEKFMYPRPSDMRYQWAVARLDQLTHKEMEEYVFDAWRMVVPKKVAAEISLLRDAPLPASSAPAAPRAGTRGARTTGRRGR